MRISRKEPGFIVSSAVHGGLLLAALAFFSDAGKFDDAQEALPVEVLSDSQFNQIMKGEKSAREIRPRADRLSETAENRPKPPLAEAKKDVPTPPPPLKRLPDPGEDDAREPPTPPRRVAALPPPPAPEPPAKPEAKAEAKPAPAPPVKPKAAAPAPPEAQVPDDAEVVTPKPPERPKPKAEAKETPQPPKPEKPKPRLKADEVAKLLARAKPSDKTDPQAKSDAAEGEPAEKPEKAVKPKAGDETAPESKFSASDIADLLSRVTPQRRAAAGKEVSRTASLGAPEGSAPKMSASMEGRIRNYIHDHYHPCWASSLSLTRATYAPIVEFHLTREGALESRPRLLNPSSDPVARARGERALQAVRECSPMKIPPEFMPYYEEALHEVNFKFMDSD